MKKYILLSFFLSINLHSAYNEIHLLSLPQDLICYILNFVSYKTGYKNIIISKAYYDALYEYLLYKQNRLLSKNNIFDAEKKQIVFNNRILLGYLRKDALRDEEKTIMTWNYGALKYLFKNNQYQIFYVPKNTDEKLHTLCVTNMTHTDNPNLNFDFLEWDCPQTTKYSHDTIREIFNMLKTKNCIMKFSHPFPDGIDLSMDFNLLFKNNPSIKLFFSHIPKFVSFPSNFNKLKINSLVKTIYFSPNKKNRSLSLQLVVDKNTTTDCFKDLVHLVNLNKLTLQFCGDIHNAPNIKIFCPSGLKTLRLKNCPCKIFIPKSLENLKIISPQKKCDFKSFDNIDFSINDIHCSDTTKLALQKLYIKNDSNNYMQSILQNLEIDQPQNTFIENCTYDQLTPRFNKSESLLLK